MRSLLDHQVDPVFSGMDEGVSRAGSVRHSIRDVLMSALAMFAFKSRSLLEFETQTRRASGAVAHNLRTLYGVREAPSDETLRQRLDQVDPAPVGRIFKRLFAVAQRTKVVQRAFHVHEGRCLIAIDGTGIYSSRRKSCAACCVRRHEDGIEYLHQMVLGAVVHPDHHGVLLPSEPEFVSRADGESKNDCERNATKRYLARFRTEHPHLGGIVLLDALHANEPMIRLLGEHRLNFVIRVKEGDHKGLFRQFRTHCRGEVEDASEDGRAAGRRVRYGWNLPLTGRPDAARVNMVATTETPPGKTEETTWQFLTDLPVDGSTAAWIAALGRTRWHIENETYQTLKDQDRGVRLERNYGHGHRHLMTHLALSMLLAFQLDQLQTIGCAEFRAALDAESGRPTYLWTAMRTVLHRFEVDSWSTFFGCIARGVSVPVTEAHVRDPPG